MIAAIRNRLSWQSFGALAVLFALNAVALVLLLDAISRQQNAANYAQRAEQAVAASAGLERLVVDMESGVRGYLLTGATRFLEPYQKALVLYPTESGALIQTATTTGTQGAATEIQTHIDQCTDCLGEYDLERVVKSLVSRSCSEVAPEVLREKVLFSIRTVHVEITE